MHALPVLATILCLMAIAYRYYSAFIAAKVATLDDMRATPAVRLNDHQNFHPTNKWVLFGHHFAAISGAGPLIGPVLAAQFGYLPGLLWIVIGVCLGGAVQDFLVLVASTRRNGKSLAQMTYDEIGKTAGSAAMVGILFILIIALAGLGKVVVNALAGQSVKYPADARLTLPAGAPIPQSNAGLYVIPRGATLGFNFVDKQPQGSMTFVEELSLKSPTPLKFDAEGSAQIPPDARRIEKGSSWGVFTIAATIPIALFVGLYMYKIRPGHVVEASLIGGLMTLGVTVIGGFIEGTPIDHLFNLTPNAVIISMGVYGFIASVLPVWVLLCPRDYLSSFLKIGTIALLVIGTMLANPVLKAPAINHAFLGGGPVVPGKVFPFLFITIMCGAISGFHALVSSGTTPKMVSKETQTRMIGYGAMLIEGLVGVVAMIAAAALPMRNYYAMNTQLEKVPTFEKRLESLDPHNDTLGNDEALTHESLRGRTGGAVTLAVGMASIFDDAARRIWSGAEPVMQKLYKYWYHFAIMFEALFILTTIDTGTRIGRFVLQEIAGKFHPKLGQTDWWPGAILSTALIVIGWSYFIQSDSFDTIWQMFGVANQTLAVIALCVVSVILVNEGKVRYVWVTLCPLCVVLTTTSSAAAELLMKNIVTLRESGGLKTADIIKLCIQSGLITAMLIFMLLVILSGAIRAWRSLDIPRNTPYAPGRAG